MSVSCLECGVVSDGASQFCSACGASLTQGRAEASTAQALRPCPACSNNVALNASFCPSCGFDFRVDSRLTYAGAWVRFFASLLDSIVILIPDIVILGTSSDFVTFYILAAGLGFVYHVGSWTIWGGTPGKLMLGLRVVLKDGSPVTPGSAVLRYLGYMVNSLTLGIGYFVILFNDEKRGLHDYIAGTVVIHSR